MQSKIFITGVAGSGKSTISRALISLGYKAYDIEADEYGLFMMIRKDTGERYTDYDNTDLDKVANARWVCDINKLKEFLLKQVEDLAFYCGISDDNIEIMSLFDMSILLKVNPNILDQRLLKREGTDDFANTAAGRQRVLGWKDEFEDRMIKAGMIPTNANLSPEEVAKNIIKITNKSYEKNHFIAHNSTINWWLWLCG